MLFDRMFLDIAENIRKRLSRNLVRVRIVIAHGLARNRNRHVVAALRFCSKLRQVSHCLRLHLMPKTLCEMQKRRGRKARPYPVGCRHKGYELEL